MQHLVTDAVDDGEGDVGAVLRRIDVNAERPFAEWCVDHFDDGIRHGGRVGLRRHDRGERLLDLLSEPGIGTRFIFRDTRPVGRRTRMREMIGTASERARDDDRGCA
jgi:hypothetical protein